MTKPDLDALLTRDAAAAALSESGFPVSGATLATMATRGGGPAYRLFGRRPLYRWGDALDWAIQRTSPPRRSSAEGDVVDADFADKMAKRLNDMRGIIAA